MPHSQDGFFHPATHVSSIPGKSHFIRLPCGPALAACASLGCLAGTDLAAVAGLGDRTRQHTRGPWGPLPCCPRGHALPLALALPAAWLLCPHAGFFLPCRAVQSPVCAACCAADLELRVIGTKAGEESTSEGGLWEEGLALPRESGVVAVGSPPIAFWRLSRLARLHAKPRRAELTAGDRLVQGQCENVQHGRVAWTAAQGPRRAGGLQGSAGSQPGGLGGRALRCRGGRFRRPPLRRGRVRGRAGTGGRGHSCCLGVGECRGRERGEAGWGRKGVGRAAEGSYRQQSYQRVQNRMTKRWVFGEVPSRGRFGGGNV